MSLKYNTQLSKKVSARIMYKYYIAILQTRDLGRTMEKTIEMMALNIVLIKFRRPS